MQEKKLFNRSVKIEFPDSGQILFVLKIGFERASSILNNVHVNVCTKINIKN